MLLTRTKGGKRKRKEKDRKSASVINRKVEI